MIIIVKWRSRKVKVINVLGYRIYFNGNKFAANEVATEVQTMPDDSTTAWFANKKSAVDAVEHHNTNNLKDIKKVQRMWRILLANG